MGAIWVYAEVSAEGPHPAALELLTKARSLGDDIAAVALGPLRSERASTALAIALGEDLEGTERQLARWHHHPAICRESALWAWREHAQASLDDPEPPRAA